VIGLVLAACGGAAPYGSFVTGHEPIQVAIAADAAKKLAAAFPAEGQAIRIGHDARDAFGRGFATALRAEGFAIRATPSDGELVVRYVLDEIHGTELLRVTIYVRGQTLARAYEKRASALVPLGLWSHGGAHGS
jgi:hypothetical protein